MSEQPMLGEETAPAPEAPSWPPTYAGFDRVGAMLPVHGWQPLLDVIAACEVERKRTLREYWTFEQYERVFAVAKSGTHLKPILLRPLEHIEARYRAARAAHLSPFQFYLSECRFRDAWKAREAALAAQTRESVARDKAKAYKAMVEEAEIKERARREGRENVERERASRRAAPRARAAAKWGHEPVNDAPTLDPGEQEYQPPDHPFA